MECIIGNGHEHLLATRKCRRETRLRIWRDCRAISEKIGALQDALPKPIRSGPGPLPSTAEAMTTALGAPGGRGTIRLSAYREYKLER
jgi:hypothetical protein